MPSGTVTGAAATVTAMDLSSDSFEVARVDRRAFISLAVGGAAVLAGCGRGRQRQTLVGYQLDPAPLVGDLSLPDVTNDGKEFALRATAGGMLLTFFGFTSCPDICPMTLATMSRALNRLGPALGSKVTVAMIAVDPSRDTPERLAQYVGGPLAGGHGLRSDDDTRLREVAARFMADYLVDTGVSGEPRVSHTSSVYVIDDTGTVVLVWQFGIAAKDMEMDLRLLLGDRT
jgi:protein SCO1/2